MMAGNPNWWSMHPPSSMISPQYVIPSSSIPFNSLTENLEPPQSWSQLLFTGIAGEEERLGFSHFQPKKFENWDAQILNTPSRVPILDVIKQEVSQSGNLYGHGREEFQASGPTDSSWSHMVPVSSPRSCVTSLSSNNMLNFTYNKGDHRKNQLPDQTSECDSTIGICKNARVHASSSQASLKVRKEKLGDRITALHQLVSPFGKTDTASVLLEAIGYIRFLQGQIEALSSPYLDNASKNMRNQQSVHGERNSVFPEDPGQLLNDNNGLKKRKGAPNQDAEEKAKDLRSRGLCLVPVSCTQHVGSENGADYWAPAYGSGC
ncbi:transcription factor bHLH68-like [Abrus precatorius]|uniref:Transcription factor bHLH68-like n=1 Tax=Abrus precatorius TaxID=3816 RepID=A0A8B8KFJ0_ABRPR|nr:transcription factor bHLH68-like [Abrus precatorius]XP_027341983.1 transcription factor bHLH68-like [Abrus precatorius]